MSFLKFAVWLSLLFQDLHLFGVRGAYGQWVMLPYLETYTNLKDLQSDLENSNKFVFKRDTAVVEGPQVFKFELADAKEPDEDTKKFIQKRGRELQLNVTADAAVNDTSSERIKRSTQKIKPQLIPFLISDAKEPDSATKELIRQSRAKELSKVAPTKQRSPKKRPTTSTKAPVSKAPPKATKETLRPGRVRKLPSATQTRQRPTKKSSKSRRTRRYAQFTEPRYIKFELHDAKNPNAEPDSTSYYHQNDTENYFDSSVGESRQRYYFQRSPVKPPSIAYPKRYGQNDVVLKVSKFQKYIASGQGLENINTNIEISIPPTVTTAAVVENLIADYPEQTYGKKLCPYAGINHMCGMNSIHPQYRQFARPAHNLVYKPEVSNVHQQQYQHVNLLPQSEAYVNQQQVVAQVQPFQPLVHVNVEPQQQQELQVPQNHVEDQTLNKDQSLQIAYIQPSYVYGDRPYPYAPNVASHQQTQPIAEQTIDGTVAAEAGLKPQEGFLNSIANNIENQNQIYSLHNNKEFQDLSALIGKSPQDQVHGLSYLLAKEMQRQKRFKPQRPQDQTSPIVFHPQQAPNDNNQVVQQQNFEAPKIETNQVVPPRQHRQLYKIYPEVVEQNTHVNQVHAGSVNTDVKAVGLSPNYNGIDANNNAEASKDYSQDESESVYASKYAFGYRVRDFDTGNDFAHKQNRDANGVTHGQYHILLPDGRIQNVIYYADETGFHADVSY